MTANKIPPIGDPLSLNTTSIGTGKTGDTVKKILQKNSPEVKELIHFIKISVAELYKDNSELSIEKSGEKRDILVIAIAQKCRDLGFDIDSNKNPLTEVMKIFWELGYYFVGTPIPVGREKYVVTFGLSEVGKPEVFNLGTIEIPGIPKVQENMPVTTLVKTLIPDYRTIQIYSDIYGGKAKFTAFTTGDSKTGEMRVFVNEENIQPNLKFGYNRIQVRTTSLNNEAGSYIAGKFIGDPKLFLAPLSLFGIQLGTRDFTLFQLNETIGDYTSLKYGGTFKSELMRLLTTNMENYALSKILIDAAFRSALRKEKFGFEGGKPLEPQLKKLGTEKTQLLKKLILEELDKVLLPIIERVHSVVKSTEE